MTERGDRWACDWKLLNSVLWVSVSLTYIWSAIIVSWYTILLATMLVNFLTVLYSTVVEGVNVGATYQRGRAGGRARQTYWLSAAWTYNRGVEWNPQTWTVMVCLLVSIFLDVAVLSWSHFPDVSQPCTCPTGSLQHLISPLQNQALPLLGREVPCYRCRAR